MAADPVDIVIIGADSDFDFDKGVYNLDYDSPESDLEEVEVTAPLVDARGDVDNALENAYVELITEHLVLQNNVDIKEIPFQFYPNPVTDYLILPIPFKEAAIANFYSMDGKLCYSNALGDARQSVIDLSLLSNGYYIMSIISGNRHITEKIEVLH